jgi:hypothetical protein
MPVVRDAEFLRQNRLDLARSSGCLPSMIARVRVSKSSKTEWRHPDESSMGQTAPEKNHELGSVN